MTCHPPPLRRDVRAVPGAPAQLVPRWAVGVAALGVLLFATSLATTLACTRAGCDLPAAARTALGTDTIGGLPRLFTTVLLALTAGSALRGTLAASGAVRRWWVGVVAVGAALCWAKLTSEHSVLENEDGRSVVLLAATAGSVAVAVLLWRTAARWSVPGGPAVVLALLADTAAALGLDQLTQEVAGTGHQGLTVVATTLEEGGEASTALVLLLVVRWAAHRVRRDRSPSVPCR
ncbi:hypothetical protein GB931_08515 [Modestobacter sp. I12A-02628]|uniref:Uncharacterized protein n=1 Tax=Goekera deserti TaxID=2497753 RepID=A0A7K3WH09_9ACTN|nr:hypothetical protein [Goekera deserti]MPQ97965.1 hypothetical protein [Goekera deserti]NDI48611.1 hypothetical protein [Goekera deserti]NEL55010.1 hypothetical protein [Goekera deserti]